GISSVARAWLVARHEDLKVTAVLATVAIERLIGGIVLTALVPLTLAVVVVPGPNGMVQNTLIWTAGVSFALFALLLIAFAGYRMPVISRPGSLACLVRRLPLRVGT